MKLTLCALFNVSKYLTGLSQYNTCTDMTWKRDRQLSCRPQTISHSHNHASRWHLCSSKVPMEQLRQHILKQGCRTENEIWDAKNFWKWIFVAIIYNEG